jgi:hypothetical protein
VADTAAVGIGQSGSHALDDSAGLERLEALVVLEQAVQRHTIDVVHRDVVPTARLVDVKDPNNVGVIQARGDHHFAVQGPDGIAIRDGALVEEFQGNLFPGGLVACQVHGRRGPLPDFFQNFIAVQGFGVQYGRPLRKTGTAHFNLFRTVWPGAGPPLAQISSAGRSQVG